MPLEPDSGTERRLLPFLKGGKPNVIEQAYLDVYLILLRENRCSSLFGGARSLVVLNQLVPQMRTAAMGTHALIRMSGAFTLIEDARNRLSYRLFERVQVNLDSEFYRFSSSPGQRRVVPIGRMPPGSREARAVAVLHELGHLIRGSNGEWLLADDGDNPALSSDNTTLIAERCRDAITSTTPLRFTEELTQIESGALNTT